jgi:hypothetical protein
LVKELLEHSSHNQDLVDQELDKFQNLCQSVNAEFAEYLPVAEKIQKMNDNIRQKYADLQKVQKIQDDRVAELQDTVERYENLLSNTRTYSASMGSVLSAMLWKICKSETVVETLLMEARLVEDFMKLAHGTLLSFMDAAPVILANEGECEEYNYVLGLCGTLVNIAAHPKGRQTLLSLPNGLKFIHNAAHSVSSLPMPRGRALKRLILLFLHNITINKKGSYFLNSYQSAVRCIFKCLELTENGEELMCITLRILLPLAEETESLDHFKESIELAVVEQVLSGAETEDLQNLARQFLEKLQHTDTEAQSGDNE